MYPCQNELELVTTTLLRDKDRGLGFSIAGGKGSDPFEEDSDSVFVSKVAEGGTADRDGKLRVGDRLIQINHVDVSGAEHNQVVDLLTGHERFVSLVVERRADPDNPTPASAILKKTTSLFSQPSLSSLSGVGTGERADGKSPKLFGVAKPYTGLYSASSYMANRPSFMRTREPGQYGLNASGAGGTGASASSSPGSNASPSYSKLPGLSAVPGQSYGTMPESRTLPEIPRRGSASSAPTAAKTVSLPRKSAGDESSEVIFFEQWNMSDIEPTRMIDINSAGRKDINHAHFCLSSPAGGCANLLFFVCRPVYRRRHRP